MMWGQKRDLDKLERELRVVPRPDPMPVPRNLDDFAPPPRQQLSDIDRAVRAIGTFSELPTKEIDDLIMVAKDELAAIEATAQRVRNAYVEVTDKLRRQIERQREVQRFTSEAMANLAQKCAQLDLPFAAEPEPPAAAETTGL